MLRPFTPPSRLAVAAVAVACLFVGACGSSSPGTAAKKTVGVVVLASTATFDLTVAKGIKAQAQAAGWNYRELDSAGSIASANTNIEDLVTAKVNAIIVITAASTSLTAGLAQAQAAGIPVISQDGGLAPGVIGDLANVNATSAGAVIDQMTTDMAGKGQLLAFTYTPGAPCKLRDDLLLSKLQGFPGIHLTRFELPANNMVQAAQTEASAWLTRYPASLGETMAIWGCYDDPAIGGTAAAAAAGRQGVLGYGYNGAANALLAMQKGQFECTEYFDPTQIGQNAWKLLTEALAAGSSWQPQVVPGPFELVTKDTLSSFLASHPNALTS